MLPQAATDFYALQQRVNATAANEVRRLWRGMGDDFDASWKRTGPAILAVLVEAQQQVALAAVDYVPNVLRETDLPNRPLGSPQVRSFVGIASDGRSLTTLAYGAVTEAKSAIGDGATTAQALDSGGSWLETMTKLQVADAARQVVGVMTTVRKDLVGTVRVLNPPSCQRCAILAGRFYRWSTGFPRHPRCDCVNLPSQSAGWAKSEGFLTDPMDAYRQGQIRDLTAAQTKALSEGADINQVVNAYRGISTTATRRPTKVPSTGRTEVPSLLSGILGAEASIGRSPLGLLTPEGIYQAAAGDRDKAIAMLREFGYIL